MERITIRKAQPEDIGKVFVIFQKARAKMTYLPHLHTEDETQNFIKGLIEKGGVTIAFDNDNIVGFIDIEKEWVHHLYVDPTFQNHGVGKILLNHAKSISPEGLSLWVFEENVGAIQFYERKGFRLLEKRGLGHADNEENLPDRLYHWKRVQ